MVYRIPCGTCSRAYIGQTGRTLDQRLKEHKRALKSGNSAHSAVAERAMEEMHVINWEEAQVVDSHPHYTQRCTLEAWHIRSERNNLNRDVGPLPSTYNPLFIPQLNPLSHCHTATPNFELYTLHNCTFNYHLHFPTPAFIYFPTPAFIYFPAPATSTSIVT